MEFSRQEYWSGLPCPPPGDLLTQDRTCISCISCIAGRFFTPWSTGEALSSSLNSTIWHLCWEAFVGAFPGNNFLLVCWLQWQIDGETMKKVEDFILGGSKITADGDYSHEIKRCLLLGRKVMTNLASILKSKDIILPRKVCLVKAMVFPVVIYGCQSWTIKKAECIRIDAFELWCWRTLESPLDCKEIQSVHPKGNQSWIFIGRTDVEAEIPILWPPNAKSWLIWKDPDAGKDWRQEEKGTTEDEMVEWVSPTQWTRVWVKSRNWWWTGRPGVLQSMGRKESERTEPLNWTELNWCWFHSTSLVSVLPAGCLLITIRAAEKVSFLCCLPGGSDGKESACNAGDNKRRVLNPWVGKASWKKEWLSSPVFLPGEFHGQRSLAGYSPWSHKESSRLDWVT